MNRIEFVGVGVRKAGTTTLFKQLVELDLISYPVYKKVVFQKETRFFESEELNYTFYESLFCQNNKIRGEFTPSYISNPEYLKKLFDYNPDCKILYMVRDPFERIWSEYNFFKSRYKRNFVPLRQLLLENYQSISDNKFDSQNQILYNSFYGSHIKELREIFPEENIMIIQFEQFIRNQAKTIKNVLEFLNIESNNINITEDLHINKTKYDISKREYIFSVELMREYLLPEIEQFKKLTNIDYTNKWRKE